VNVYYVMRIGPRGAVARVPAYAELSDSIATPLQSTLIERNEFGVHGRADALCSDRRHIYSVGQPFGTNANWIIGNRFNSAKGQKGSDLAAVYLTEGFQLARAMSRLTRRTPHCGFSIWIRL
jgi:hypothetical protein